MAAHNGNSDSIGQAPDICLDSLYQHSPTKRRILTALREARQILTPKEIGEKINESKTKKPLSRSTVRNVLRLMVLEGSVKQPYPGVYCDSITYGVKIDPICVHNLRLRFKVNEDIESWNTTENVEDVKIYVCFGEQRKLVSGYIAYDHGMTKALCFMAIDRWIAIVEKRLGRSVNDLVVSSAEFNNDYSGRLDGEIHCVTKQVLKDTIERIYQKDDATIRKEYKVNREMSVTKFETMFNNGTLDQVLGQQTTTEIVKAQGEQGKALLSINGKILNVQQSIRAIEQKIINDAKNDDTASRLVSEMANEYRRVLEVVLERFNSVANLAAAKSVEMQELKGLAVKVLESNMKLTEALSGKVQEQIKTESPSETPYSQPLPSLYE